MATIIFACKSNSCRSQMAEAWARDWVRAERLGLEERERARAAAVSVGRTCGIESIESAARDVRLRELLDGLTVASVALDDSSGSPSNAGGGGASPSSGCVTCDGEACALPSSRRRRPKEKAVMALARDGVDMSGQYAKSWRDAVPLLADRRTRQQREGDPGGWGRRLSLARLTVLLEGLSREMGMAFAGVAREDGIGAKVADSLIVLCSCPDSMKRELSDLCGETLDWDVEAPTAAARSGEGDDAYLRVSRQIRGRVAGYLDEMKRRATAGEEFDRRGLSSAAQDVGCAPRAMPLPVRTC